MKNNQNPTIPQAQPWMLKALLEQPLDKVFDQLISGTIDQSIAEIADRYFVVAKDGSGDFTQIQRAIEAVPDDNQQSVLILIKSGIYEEKLTVQKPHITFYGEDKHNTKIIYHDYANMLMESGERRGTFRSQTMLIDANDVTIRNLTIENTAGCGTEKGPAIAVYAEGDCLLVADCIITGSQDTLFTGPLPPTPMIKDGFVGPKEHAPRLNGRQFYKNCLISGDVDYIFGSATAFFEGCTIFSRDNQRSGIKGYITAASTAKGQQYGYVFSHCHFVSNCPAQTVYLGRPWRNYAQTVLISCHLDGHIKKEGWHDWNKLEARETMFYGEFDSQGDGVAPRAPFVKILADAEQFCKEQVLQLPGDTI